MQPSVGGGVEALLPEMSQRALPQLSLPMLQREGPVQGPLGWAAEGEGTLSGLLFGLLSVFHP